MPARVTAATAAGKSAAPSILTRSAPASLARVIAARTALSVPSCTGPNGMATRTSAPEPPRRTARQTMSISASVTSSGLRWPQRLTPTESPTDTISTPAWSAIVAIWESPATPPTIFRPSRFISWSAGWQHKTRGQDPAPRGGVADDRRRLRARTRRRDHHDGVGAVELLAQQRRAAGPGVPEQGVIRDRRLEHEEVPAAPRPAPHVPDDPS